MELKTSDISINSFEDMGLAEDIVRFIQHRGIKKPTEIQARAIPLALEGHNLIGIAQTGSGKTMAFVLPVLAALTKKPTSRAIAFAPSREMAQQIHKVFSDLSLLTEIEPVLVTAGTPNDKQVSALRKLPRLIVATPGRMLDHLHTNKLLLKGVEHIVIDEADRMLDMGFAPQLEKIRATLRGQWQTLMFSASVNASVEKLSTGFFQSPPYLLRGNQAESPVAKLKQTVIFMRKNQKNDQLLIELKKTKKSVIIFAADQSRCEEIGQYLQYNGVKSDFIHGDMVQGHRNRVVREFREGANRILVSTDLLARGLDIPEIGTVINVDLPYEPEDFLHRIGRTARAGRSGQAITFVSQLDAERFKKIESYLVDAEVIKLDPRFAFQNSK
ncbi:MAG: hypothetical protein RJB66_182 [Pseudomonadota bacterium]|jgi:superfamily II DNA/RNA helicase